MDLNWRKQYVGVLETEYDGITYYFIDNEYYFNGFAPYGDMYADIEKFAFFSKAVLSALPLIDFRPDIIHCHDWQTGLVPIYLDNFRFGKEYYRGIKTIMTIHNLKFQGTWDTKRVRDITGLPQYYFAPHKYCLLSSPCLRTRCRPLNNSHLCKLPACPVRSSTGAVR